MNGLVIDFFSNFYYMITVKVCGGKYYVSWSQTFGDDCGSIIYGSREDALRAFGSAVTVAKQHNFSTDIF